MRALRASADPWCQARRVDTSGENLSSIVLFLVVIALYVQVAVRLLDEWRPRRRFPWLAVVLAVLIGVPSLLQFALPGIGSALDRDPDATLQHAQWWRVVSAVAAQDGGLVAAIFNLVVIAVVVALAEPLWGEWRTLVLFFVPSLVLNLLAIILWRAPGGGSSFASDGLMLSVCGLALVLSTRSSIRLLASVAVVAALVLVVLGDAHGVAMLVGAALGGAAGLVRRRRRRETRVNA